VIASTYHIDFLTPCFCGGADPAHAELRPPALRGQLRWWFRCLGGSPAEEREAFGGVQGEDPRSTVCSSTFRIRARMDPHPGAQNWYSASSIPPQGTGPRTYLLGFFCGRTGRLNPRGALAPGRRAEIEVHFRVPPSPRLSQAIRVFFSVGAVGFRITRCAGAIASREHSLSTATWPPLVAELERAGFRVALASQEYSDWIRLIDHAGDLLKNCLRSRDGLAIRAGRDGSVPNALGSADPRQASALSLRPVRLDGRLRLALIEAPHARVLGPDALAASRTESVVDRAADAGVGFL